MEVPRRIDLRTQHRIQVTWRLCRENSVVEDSRGVDDGSQRMRDRYPGQESLQRISVRRVARCDPYGSTEPGELRFDRGGTFGRLALSADEQQVARTMTSHQMPGKQRPEHAGTARNQHRAFGIEWHGHGEHQLANVAGTAQESIRIGCLSNVPRTQRKRTQYARLEELHQLAKHLAIEFRSDIVEEIERMVLNSGMPGRHLARVSDVCFAQLDEPSTARQESQRRIDEFLFQAIEYDVHTGPVGCRGKLLLEFERA